MCKTMHNHIYSLFLQMYFIPTCRLPMSELDTPKELERKLTTWEMRSSWKAVNKTRRDCVRNEEIKRTKT